MLFVTPLRATLRAELLKPADTLFVAEAYYAALTPSPRRLSFSIRHFFPFALLHAFLCLRIRHDFSPILPPRYAPMPPVFYADAIQRR